MIAYHDTLSNFNYHIENNLIVTKILEKMGQNVSDSEKRSMKISLGEMYKVLKQSSVPLDVRVGIEYKIPITSKRIDFLISGSNDYSDNIVVVELKRWEKVNKTDMPSVILLGKELKTHPSWQAYSYAAIISHFNEAVEKNDIKLNPCAFLHDYRIEYLDQLTDNVYHDAINKAPVFIESDYEKLRHFIEKYIKYPSKKDLLFEIDNGKIKPSKMLIDALGNMLNNNKEFELLDEQRVVFELLYKEASKRMKDGKKKVFIVEGGAGTGKSVIAIELLSNLIMKKGFTAFYVSKSSYVRENYFSKLTRNIPNYTYLKTLFKGSGSFIESMSNEFDCLIVDEAHRLTEKTKMSWFYKGENQIKEIINAAKTSVFFIDPKQQIDIKDYGTIEEITKWANYFNAEIYHGNHLQLKSQFRCNGSDEYISWIDSVLYNEPFERSSQIVDYDIRIFDDIMEMKKAVIEKNTNNKSRIISGDVFPWKSRTDKSQIDIIIGDFQAQWNRTKTFATDPNSIDEVGCIHTTQGMEFEYVGLIIGDDLIYRNGITQTDYTKHPSGATEFKRPHKRTIDPNDNELIDLLIRNTYRVLMSRGQKGCYIYCMDKDLRNYLKQRIKELKTLN
ncbi:MAG TPA: DUF2075 domain-containing protein [Acholeplasmataceae bacterium]|nr:DUF2075 domain-containing protein [Acholeplasmataceae bacterium]